MKILQELVKLISLQRVSRIDVMENKATGVKRNKYDEFYEAITQGLFDTDETAAKHFYGASEQSAKYRKLKSRFRRRLLNAVFFLAPDRSIDIGYDEAYYSCLKDMAAASILVANEGLMSAAEVATSVQQLAEKYQFYALIIESSLIIREYALETGDARLFQRNNDLIVKCQPVLEADFKVRQQFQELRYMADLHLNSDAKMLQKANGLCMSQLAVSEQVDKPEINIIAFVSWVYYYEMARDFDNLLEMSQQALEYYQEHKEICSRKWISIVYAKMMCACMHLKDYRSGVQTIQLALRTFEESANDWLQFMEYYLLLAIHTENYLPAVAIFLQALDHKVFIHLNTIPSGKWFVYHGYIHYVNEVFETNNPLEVKYNRKSFQLDSFLNNPFSLPLEHPVLNMQYALLRILFHIERRTLRDIHDVVDRIGKHGGNYLQRGRHDRHIFMIQWLNRFCSIDFQPKLWNRLDNRYAKLTNVPYYYNGQLDNLEVIRYENLIDLFYKRLTK